MKTLYLIDLCGLPDGYDEDGLTPDVGEWQGLFNEKFEVLDFWGCNDQLLSHNYIKGTLETLGYNLKTSKPKQHKQMEITLYEKAKEIVGD